MQLVWAVPHKHLLYSLVLHLSLPYKLSSCVLNIPVCRPCSVVFCPGTCLQTAQPQQMSRILHPLQESLWSAAWSLAPPSPSRSVARSRPRSLPNDPRHPPSLACSCSVVSANCQTSPGPPPLPPWYPPQASKSALDNPEVLCYASKSEAMYVRESLIFRSDSNGEDLEGYAGERS